MKKRTEKNLQKHIDKLKYWKLQRWKVNKKICCELATIRRITRNKHWGRKDKVIYDEKKTM